MPEQTQFKEFLLDPVFKAWFNRKPSDPPPGNTSPWVVWVQKEHNGKWSRARFKTYAKAHKYVRSIYKDVWDLTLGCLRRDYGPPLMKVTDKTTKQARAVLWRGMPEGHSWCGYCRRPVVFAYFSRHHAVPKNMPCNGNERRCSICGAREAFVRKWYRT